MGITQDEDHSGDAPILEGTDIRVADIVKAYEHEGYDPDEIPERYLELSLNDVHTALAY